MQRSTMQDAISAPNVGGIVRLTRFILRGTFVIELLGVAAMLPVFCRDYGWRGVWMAVFHSVSAFCNAGFDILGTETNLYPSLTGYAGSPIINITIMLPSFFQSVTPRTAGFNTVNLSAMSGASQGLMILLMLVGGSPGSTAGGMKTTTLAVLLANAAATFRQRESAQFFGRRIDCGAVKTAATILTMYVTLFFCGAVFISVYENLPLSSCLYETASAVGRSFPANSGNCR